MKEYYILQFAWGSVINSEKIKIVFRVQVQIFAQMFFLNVLKIVANKTSSIMTTRETT